MIYPTDPAAGPPTSSPIPNAPPVGGDAFPTTPLGQCSPGLSALDYFAAQAMQGLVTRENTTFDEDAVDAYEIAEAMLAERNRRNKTP